MFNIYLYREDIYTYVHIHKCVCVILQYKISEVPSGKQMTQ